MDPLRSRQFAPGAPGSRRVVPTAPLAAPAGTSSGFAFRRLSSVGEIPVHLTPASVFRGTSGVPALLDPRRLSTSAKRYDLWAHSESPILARLGNLWSPLRGFFGFSDVALPGRFKPLSELGRAKRSEPRKSRTMAIPPSDQQAGQVISAGRQNPSEGPALEAWGALLVTLPSTLPVTTLLPRKSGDPSAALRSIRHQIQDLSWVGEEENRASQAGQGPVPTPTREGEALFPRPKVLFTTSRPRVARGSLLSNFGLASPSR